VKDDAAQLASLPVDELGLGLSVHTPWGICGGGWHCGRGEDWSLTSLQQQLVKTGAAGEACPLLTGFCWRKDI